MIAENWEVDKLLNALLRMDKFAIWRQKMAGKGLFRAHTMDTMNTDSKYPTLGQKAVRQEEKEWKLFTFFL